MKKLIFFTGFCCLYVIAYSQPAWLKNLKIRQSFNDDESKQNPAALSLTFPKDKSSSYLVDLSFGQVLRKSADGLKTGNLIAEFHRTNLSDEEVNNFQLGYKHQLIFKAAPTKLPVEGVIADYNTLRLNSTAKYRADKIERSKGIAGTFLLTYFQQGTNKRTWFSSPKYSNSKKFHYVFVPQFGFEMQENFKADSTVYKGFVGRSVGNISLTFGGSRADPKDPIFPIGIWEFTIDAAARYDVVGKSYTDSKFHPLIKTSLDFFLSTKPVKATLGGSFMYGDNPVEGFREFKFKPQQFWVIALKLQK